MIKLHSLIIGMLLMASTLMAQDYTRQVTALEQSFKGKDVSIIKVYLSTELKFDPVPADKSLTLLTNLVANFPPIDSIKILESGDRRAKVEYSLANKKAMPASAKEIFDDSYLYFDSEGKIVRIEIIERIIKRGIEEQKKLAKSVQIPDPGELADKYPSKTIEFPAADGLLITGDLYEIGKERPVILLCHQGGYNRLEFLDIARNLNELGFNCLAIDQRSGGQFAGKPNLTSQRAIENGLAPQMIDARQDIVAAIDYLYLRYNQRVVILGSSYSSSLVLFEGAVNGKVKGIIAFSPGNYFQESPELSTVIPTIKIPFLIASSKEEAVQIGEWVADRNLKTNQRHFVPETEGFHGARVLWNGQKGAEEYWSIVKEFLTQVK